MIKGSFDNLITNYLEPNLLDKSLLINGKWKENSNKQAKKVFGYGMIRSKGNKF